MKLVSVLCIVLLTACNGFKRFDLQTQNSKLIRAEAERLNLPEDLFVTPNQVLLGGDILIDPQALVREDGALKLKTDGRTVRAQGNTIGKRWSRTVPIYFDDDVPTDVREKVLIACDDFSVRCTCYDGEADYVHVNMRGRSVCGVAGACANYPRGGATGLYLSDWTDYKVIAHELGHNLGLTHEQQRADRDLYVESAVDSRGYNSNDIEGSMTGPFDFESIMLYPCSSGVILRDLNLCDRNGFINSRVSDGDRSAAKADRGSSDLRACGGGATPAATPGPTPAPQQPSSSVLTITVIDNSTGAPINGALVQVGPYALTTNSDGVVSGEVPHGSYTGSVRAAGYDILSGALAHTGPQTVTVRLMRPAFTAAPPPAAPAPVPAPQPVPGPAPAPTPVTQGLLKICLTHAGSPVAGATVTVGPYSQVSDGAGCVSGVIAFGTYGATATLGNASTSGTVNHFSDPTIINYDVP